MTFNHLENKVLDTLVDNLVTEKEPETGFQIKCADDIKSTAENTLGSLKRKQSDFNTRKPVKEIKKRKFLQPSPDMRLKHQQVVKTQGKDFLICNGIARVPVAINKKVYCLGNTSKFDVFT